MIKLRYPSITGIKTEDRQKQMESFIRYLVDTLNVILGSEKKTEETQKQEVQTTASPAVAGAVKENAKAIKANAEAIAKNTAAIADNAAAVAESLWYARFVLDGDQKIATASTYQDLKLKKKYGHGDFYTLASDGKSITITKDLVATVSAQVYYSTAHSASGALRSQVLVDGAQITRGACLAVAAAAYTSTYMVGVTRPFTAGEVITLQAYGPKVDGMIPAYDFYTYLNIDVKGITNKE